MTKNVLIVAHFYEPNVNKVISKLNDRKVNWIRFNTETFPLLTSGSWKLDNSSDLDLSFSFDNRLVNINDITSIWYRRFGKFILPQTFNEQERIFATSESQTFIRTLFNSTKALWINPREAEIKSNDKPFQLLKAKEIGFKIPKTLITNNPNEVKDFYNTSTAKIIFKPLSGVSYQPIDYTKEVYNSYSHKFKTKPYIAERPINNPIVFTQFLDDQKIKQIETVQFSPLIFQEYIDKKYELRITVVGQRIFACKIYSQEFEETSIDFRKFALLEKKIPKHQKENLPIEIEERILMLMKTLGLIFGCIDMIVTPNDEYIFLEINPSGQWLWIEEFTDFKITDALVDILVC